MSEPSARFSPARDAFPAGALSRILLWSAAIATGGLAFATGLQAFVFPLELELREGTAWLHVLAQQAGLSLYDHGQLAYVNMNHGPLDPLLKYWLSVLLPSLTPAMVTRVFVVALPGALLLAGIRATRGNLPAALVLTGGLYLLLLGLQPPHFLVGRSDPTALFLLALMAWNAAGPTPPAALPGGASYARHAATGLLGAMVILANWRYFPAVGAVAAGYLFESLASLPRHRAFGIAVRATLASALGALVPFALVLGGLFHGDTTLYHRHFFGFFSADSGWGTTRADTFTLFPAALFEAHGLLHLTALGSVALGLWRPASSLPRKIQGAVWLPLLGLLWLSTSIAYFLNHGGGGLYYYAPCYLLLALHLARAVDWPAILPLGRTAIVGLLLAGLPWGEVWRQCVALHNSFEDAHSFIAACRDTAGEASIYSEEYHLFKARYGGELIDMGDEVFAVSRSGYFGPAFTATANRQFAALQQQPPAFVLTGGLASEPLQALLVQAYTPALRIPYRPSYAGPAQTLYRRKSPSGASPTAP